MSDGIELALEPTVNPGKALPPLPRLSGYELIREKGRGPKSVVYKARRIFENDIVAVKYYHPGACDAFLQARLEAAIERTAKFEHPGLIRALGLGREGDSAFLVLEYASGEALSSFLFRRQQFPTLKTIAVILHCARTLKSAAANGFFHGRLHPGAIILGRNTVRISGVGMGERPEHAEWPVGKNQAPHVYEPLIYTAPEAMPSKAGPWNSAAADIYSLGAILFHMLAGAPPFKCSDEGTLEQERAALKPKHPVVWPVDVFAKLTPETIELVESMLAPDPAARPNYDSLILRCMALQNVLRKAGAAEENDLLGDGSAPQPASKAVPGSADKTVVGAPKALEGKERARAKSSENLVATVPLSKSAKIDGSATAPAAKHSVRRMATYAPRSMLDLVFSAALFLMTGLVLLCVVYITLQPQLPKEYQFAKGLMVNENPPVAVPDSKTPNGPKAPLAPAPETTRQIVVTASPEEQALALRQLDKIQEMLRSNEIMPSLGLTNVLRSIADKAGRATPTGIRAAILAGDIEAHLAPGKQSDTITPELAKALASAAEAMQKAAAQPPAAPANPPAPVTPPTPPAPATPAKVEKPVEAPKPAAPAVAGASAPLQQARAQLKYFGYAKAKEIVTQFASKGDAAQKKLADDFKTTMNYEEGLYERCRTKLVEQIKKSPKHESPLQVFPRKDDPVGDDIINFDDKGLHILVRGGPTPGEKVTPWEKLPPAQIMNLLTPLTTKSSLEDQLGLAAFAFNRGLSAESDDALAKAQAIAGGKEKATELTDIFARITRALDAK